jgi:UDP-4-amino-4,6-dideoxy-N-acetyl-beta-L-altrosamine transaminase/dTDP-4-dehydrorhamnose reductase
MKRKILFTGGSGLLAINWAICIADDSDVILGLHRQYVSIPGVRIAWINMESAAAFSESLEKIQPDIVIHCAGLTNVEKCENDPSLAQHVNVELAINVATACNQKNIKLVYISTDHLVAGDKPLVTEEEPVFPMNRYAQTKSEAENRILAISKESLVIRTNFYGWGTNYRDSFSDFIISNLRKGKTISLFKDFFYTPILIEDLANIAMQLLSHNASGIFNVVGDERISKLEFGNKLARRFGLDTKLIQAVRFSDRKDLIKRPTDLSLSNQKTKSLLNNRFGNIDENINRLYEQEKSESYNTVSSMIPYGRQHISEEDIQAVVKVLRSDWLTQGPLVPAFEKAVATYCGAGYGVAVNSATSALHIACLALEIGRDDIVWTSPITFVASANCAVYCGASVDFVDVDHRTYNMSVEALEIKLEKAAIEKKLPKVVIPVHLAGQSCDMESIHQLSKKYGFKIIEDASHCIGGKYKNEPIGNCRYSSITVFSFHPVKIITTGEGGMAMTNDHDLALSMAHLRSHGIVRYEHEMTHAPDGPWYYQQIGLGYNYRMTDIQGALGLSQMNRLDEFVQKRHTIAKRYNEILTADWLTLPWQHPDTYSGYHLYIIRIKKDNGVIDHLSLFKKLRAAGILVNLHYIPVYRQPFYEKMGFQVNDFPGAESYYEEAISLPMFPGLTSEQQDFVATIINNKTEAPAVDDKPQGFQNIF